MLKESKQQQFFEYNNCKRNKNLGEKNTTKMKGSKSLIFHKRNKNKQAYYKDEENKYAKPTDNKLHGVGYTAEDMKNMARLAFCTDVGEPPSSWAGQCVYVRMYWVWYVFCSFL